MKEDHVTSNDYLQIPMGDLKQEKKEQQEQIEDDSFEIPCLPKGKTLTLKIHSNWGDEHFVGLNGIEIFDAKTFRSASIEKVRI